MKNMKQVMVGVAALALVAGGANAADVNYSTGINVSGGVDQNWKLVSVTDAYPGGNSVTPPGGTTAQNAYLVNTPDGNFPLDVYWMKNSASTDSKWISYNSTLQVGGDTTGGYYDYRLTFTTPAVSRDVKWLSDNSSTLYLDGVTSSGMTRSDAQPFYNWNTPVSLNLSAGTHTLDLIVYNIPQDNGNPTGARVEFFAPVPEPSTFIAGALLLLPFGVSTLRSLRRKS
jgi:hypothetical protein